MVNFLRLPVVAVAVFIVGTTTLTLSVTGDMTGSHSGGGSNNESNSGPDSGEPSISFCGDKTVQGLEQCDDGNGDNNDGCTINCMLPKCGDGYVQSNHEEECDDGTLNGPTGRCTGECKKRLCGNSKVDNGEECDEGTVNGFAGHCTLGCKKPTSGGSNTVAACNNGIVESTEQCDDGNSVNTDDCTVRCMKAVCGDGFVQSGRGEDCDEGSVNGVPGHCTRDCKKPASNNNPPPAFCGNGITEGDEQCDDGNSNNSDQCSTLCRFIRCGDGIIQSNEECDMGPDNGHGSCNQDCKRDEDSEKNPPFITIPFNTTGQPSPTPTGIPVVPPLPTAPSSVSDTENRSGDSDSADDEMLKQRLKDAEEQAKREIKMIQEQEEQDQEPQFLGCFDGSGQWTTSREACDQNQKKHMETQTVIQTGETQQTVEPVPVQHVSDTEVKQQIEEKFLGQDLSETKRSEILSVMNTAKERLNTLLQGTNAPEVADYLQRSMDWLDQGIAYFSSGTHSVDEIQAMAEPVRDLMQQVSTVMTTVQKLPKEKPAINPIVDKTETLLTKFRSAFIALVQNGIGLDQTSLQAYVDAAQQFMNVKDACLKDNTTCSSLNDVLKKLAEARPWLNDQMTNHPDIAKKLGM